MHVIAAKLVADADILNKSPVLIVQLVGSMLDTLADWMPYQAQIVLHELTALTRNALESNRATGLQDRTRDSELRTNQHEEEDGDGVSEEDGSRARRSSCRKWFTD